MSGFRQDAPMFRFRFIPLGIALMLPLVSPVMAAPAKIDAYLIGAEGRDWLSRTAGSRSHDLTRDATVGPALRRAFVDIAGPMRSGSRSGPESFTMTFSRALEGPPDEVEIVDRRFLFAGGCYPHSCGVKSVFAVDLVTGHVIIANILDAVTVARKACANPELIAFAEARIDRWAGSALHRKFPDYPQGVDIRRTVTPCRPTVPGPDPAVAEPRIVPDTRPLFRLTPSEIASLRPLVGKRSWDLMYADPGRLGYRRVFNAIAHKKGHYSGDPDEKTASVWDFYMGIASDDPVRLVDGRFLLFGGCSRGGHCDWPALAIVDVRTGDLAVAIVHRFDVRGTLFYENGHLTTFLASCASAELAAFTRRFAPSWARKHAVLAYDAGPGRMGKPTTVTTRCR